MQNNYLNGPDFDGFVVRGSEKGLIIAAELIQEKADFKLI
jgi:hypothetical protein